MVQATQGFWLPGGGEKSSFSMQFDPEAFQKYHGAATLPLQLTLHLFRCFAMPSGPAAPDKAPVKLYSLRARAPSQQVTTLATGSESAQQV